MIALMSCDTWHSLVFYWHGCHAVVSHHTTTTATATTTNNNNKQPFQRCSSEWVLSKAPIAAISTKHKTELLVECTRKRDWGAESPWAELDSVEVFKLQVFKCWCSWEWAAMSDSQLTNILCHMCMCVTCSSVKQCCWTGWSEVLVWCWCAGIICSSWSLETWTCNINFFVILWHSWR